MLYLLYKTTNLLDGKIYVGVHQTDKLDDGYLGSGKRLLLAINKHGRENFKREVLKFCLDAEEMFAVERAIVTEEFVKRDDTYNLRTGGFGGWDHINRNGLGNRSGSTLSEEARHKIRVKKTGSKATDETRSKMRKNNAMKNRPEVRAKLAASLTKKPKSLEHRARIAASIKAWHESKRV